MVVLPDLRSALGEDYLLPRLSGYLVNAGEKVVHSNARLAEQLRRLLDEQTQAENCRVQELIQDIKHGAYSLSQRIPDNVPLLELEGTPEIQLIMERNFWEPPNTPTFGNQPGDVSEGDLDNVDLTNLYNQFSYQGRRVREAYRNVVRTTATDTALRGSGALSGGERTGRGSCLLCPGC